MNFDLSFCFRAFPMIIRYLGTTMKIAVLAMICTLVIASVVAVCRHFRVPVLNRICGGYIDLFRCTPLLVQLFFIYYGLPQIWPAFAKLNAFTVAVIGLALNAASYSSESIRSAIESVPKGQMEAGLSVGMTRFQVMRHIIAPQALKVAVPILTNDFIALVKNTSLAFTLGVREIMAEGSLVGNTNFRFFEAYLDAFIIYFFVCKIISILQKKLEKNMNSRGGVVK